MFPIKTRRGTTAKRKIVSGRIAGTQGFAGMSSLVYHLYPPTRVKQKDKPYSVQPEIAENGLDAMSFQGFQLQTEADYLKSRKVLFVILLCKLDWQLLPHQHLIFIKCRCRRDNLCAQRFWYYIHHVWRFVFQIWRLHCHSKGHRLSGSFDSDDNRWLFMESTDPVFTPRRYRNDFGQMLEHSPFFERDIQRPENLKTYDEEGEFDIFIKKERHHVSFTLYANHPLMWLVGMAFTILTYFLSSILNPLLVGFTCLLLSIRLWESQFCGMFFRAKALWLSPWCYSGTLSPQQHRQWWIILLRGWRFYELKQHPKRTDYIASRWNSMVRTPEPLKDL